VIRTDVGQRGNAILITDGEDKRKKGNEGETGSVQDQGEKIKGA